METQSRINRLSTFLALGILLLGLAAGVATRGNASLPTSSTKALQGYRADPAAADATYMGKPLQSSAIGCPDPNNCTKPGATNSDGSKVFKARAGGCPDPKNCTDPSRANKPL